MSDAIDSLIITRVTDIITVRNSRGKEANIVNRNTYGLSFCRSGQIRYRQDGKECIENEGFAVILPMEKNYSLITERGGDFPVINFLCEGYGWECVTAYPIKNPEILIREFEKMQSLSLYDGNSMKIMGIFYGILHQIFRCGESDTLTPAVKYIEEHYGDSELNNFVLAEKCHISEVYFRRLFLERFGVTPRQFLIDVRLNKAKQLLSGGAFKVSAVSELCGFTNPYHFCRAFKKHIGVTPTDYMLQNRIYSI